MGVAASAAIYFLVPERPADRTPLIKETPLAIKFGDIGGIRENTDILPPYTARRCSVSGIFSGSTYPMGWSVVPGRRRFGAGIRGY